MTEEKNWGAEPWRQPALGESETLVISECGRITHKIDYRSHWFVMVRNEYKNYSLLVKHGAGEERIPMPTVNFSVTVNAIVSMDSSDTRYLMLHHLYDINKDAARKANEATARKYQSAFVAGTLRKRRYPAKGIVKVWIEQAIEVKSA